MKTVATPAARYAVLAALVFWIAISLTPLPRPQPLAATAAPEDFSAARALDQIRAIAQKPHPPGSAEHQRVRDYLIAEFTKLGAAPEVESGFAAFTYGAFHAEGNVDNIIVRLPGSGNTRPLMLAAHYDSVTRGPGASDDGSGVAVLLETLRALRAGPPLRNDAIFLITDGEEKGLLGAQVFMRDHAWRGESDATQPAMTQPAVTLNFEARGTGGNAFMFETSAGNDWLIRDLQAAVPQADATSFAYEIYRRMPNDTDLTVFKRGGLAGMNFAYIEHPELYHTAQDNVANLDSRSLQEQGRYALALARRFGNEDLSQKHGGDAVYFPTPFTSLIVYPASWVKPIAWLAVAGLAAALTVGWKRGARGRWMAAPLATVAILQLLLAAPAPGVTYLFAWPLLAGIGAFALLMTAPQRIAMGWRVAAMLICPAPVFVLLVPLLSILTVALGARGAAPLLGLAGLLMAICVSPQLVLAMRKSAAAAGTPHVTRAIAGACLCLCVACGAFA
jgi:Peptidase family M28